jgi:hypothetical protein
MKVAGKPTVGGHVIIRSIPKESERSFSRCAEQSGAL